MSGPGWFDREVEALERDLDEGRLSQSEFNTEMRELRRDYQGAAEEASWNAYENERERW